jgi:ribokinase
MRRKPIVVVGSVNLDLVCKVAKIPVPGQTVAGRTFQTFPGGKGANQAVAVARLCYPVMMVGKVGDDEYGLRLRRGLRSYGVSVEGVRIARGASSGVAMISADDHGQNSIVVIPGANNEVLPVDLEKAAATLRSAGIILTQLEIPMETVAYLAGLARRFDVPLMLDPAPAQQLSARVLKSLTYLTPNESETLTLCNLDRTVVDRSSVADYAEHLRKRGPKNVIVKMGGRGAYVLGEGGLKRFVPAFKVKVLDSTAAGDAFNGGLAVGLLEGRSLNEAVLFASCVAALSVTRMGAQPSMPSRREVECSFWKKNKMTEMVMIDNKHSTSILDRQISL